MSEKPRILIVDDDPSARRTLKALLLQEGYDLAFAENGPETLSKAAELLPDLILLDVMMPGMDGFEVCRRLRADPLLAEAPVIMVTALDDRDSLLQGIEAGADDFISKPFNRVELRARVRTITQLNRYRRLLSERARFEWMVQQADDGYLMLNDGGEILYANPQARLYLGLPVDASEPISGTFMELVARQYRPEPQEAWATWPARESVPRYLVRPEALAAAAFWLQVDLMEMSPTSSLVHLRDVTASVAAQRDTWVFHTQVSHKLRTPLSMLVGFLDILDKEPDLPEATRRSSISSARQGALRLRGEIEDILQYVEVMIEPAQSAYSLGETPALMDDIGASLQLQSINVSYQGVENPLITFVPLSHQAMELILWELAENAKKFHPQESPTLEIIISAVSEGVSIKVCDDGLTLAPERLVKIWTPYYQAERYFTGQVAGMGLGLSTVASLVWSVGGTCRLYNREQGPGVKVELILPLAGNDKETNE